MKRDKELFIFMMIIFILIPIIIFFNPALFKYKFYFLTILGLIIFLIFKIAGVSLSHIVLGILTIILGIID